MTYQNSIQATRWRDHTGVERPTITPRSALPPARMWDDDRLDVYDLLAMLHPEWHKRAACANPYPPEDERHAEHVARWFPTRASKVPGAAAICARCPVVAECAAEAESMPGSYPGVRAGHGYRHRQRERWAADKRQVGAA